VPAQDTSPEAFLALVSARRGHFRMESGLHSALWLDLRRLFANPARIEPFVAALAEQLRPYDVDVVCGPVAGGAVLAMLVARNLGVSFCFTERGEDAAPAGLYRATYRLPEQFTSRVEGQRVALVDDVMSAGSSLRATHSELESHGASVVAIGALMVLGDAGLDYFTSAKLPVVSVVRQPFDMWVPEECPMCRNGEALEATGGNQ
jgi:orotate phosphoribosyltransferase